MFEPSAYRSKANEDGAAEVTVHAVIAGAERFHGSHATAVITGLRANTTEPGRLSDLVTRSEAWDAAFSEIPMDAQDLKFHLEGILHRGELQRPDETRRELLFEKAGA